MGCRYPGGNHCSPRRGSPVRAISLSPDGTILATITSDGTTHLWDVATASAFTNAEAVNSVAFAPVSRVLAATVPGRPGAIRLWDTANGHPIGTLPSADSSGVGSAAFSPNGQVLAVGYNDGYGATLARDLAPADGYVPTPSGRVRIGRRSRPTPIRVQP